MWTIICNTYCNCAEGDNLSKTTEGQKICHRGYRTALEFQSFGLTLLTSPFTTYHIGLSVEVSMGDCVAADIGKTDYKLVLTSFIECISQVRRLESG